MARIKVRASNLRVGDIFYTQLHGCWLEIKSITKLSEDVVVKVWEMDCTFTIPVDTSVSVYNPQPLIVEM